VLPCGNFSDAVAFRATDIAGGDDVDASAVVRVARGAGGASAADLVFRGASGPSVTGRARRVGGFLANRRFFGRGKRRMFFEDACGSLMRPAGVHAGVA